MILPDLSRRDTSAVERMDRPDCDEATLNRTYAQFRVVNAAVAGWRSAYRHHLRPVLRTGGTTTLLDIGSGGGDVARALAGWAARDGRRLEITAVDPDARAHAWAVSRPATPGLTFRRATSAELVAEGRRYDLVVSNHLLHHLDSEQLAGLLADSQRLTRIRALHSDIARHRWAYALFSAGTRPFFPGSFIREDGLISIRRSYTPEELRAVLPSDWRVLRRRPWRNLALYDVSEDRR